MERMLQQASLGADQGGKKSSSANESQGGLSEEQIEQLEEQFGYDKPVLTAYGQWLGVIPRETLISKAELHQEKDESVSTNSGGSVDSVQVVLRGSGRAASIRHADSKVLSAIDTQSKKSILDEGWKVRIETEAVRQARFKRRNPSEKNIPQYTARAVAFQTNFSGLLQGNLGRSTAYNDPVHEMILARMPIALYFGLLTAAITYAISLPLGILKALKHRTFIDTWSSVLIFLGYSIPGFALGAILLVQLGARMSLFPLFGLTSPNFEELSTAEKFVDLAHHTALPLLCYLVGSFAMLTMMTKNNLMDNLAADYVRTAVAKGASFHRAVFCHAFRNSMIPVATGLGSLVEMLIGGSILVESVFDIQGFGLLQYQSVLSRDIPVIMGTLTIAAFLMLIGHIISDLIVALVDPRIKFG